MESKLQYIKVWDNNTEREYYVEVSQSSCEVVDVKDTTDVTAGAITFVIILGLCLILGFMAGKYFS